MLLRPAFSVDINALHQQHPSLSLSQINKLLESTMASEAVQSMILDTFEILANHTPPPPPATLEKPDHENRLRLAQILHKIRQPRHSAAPCSSYTTFPDAVWKTFIARLIPDQPPHYSSSDE